MIHLECEENQEFVKSMLIKTIRDSHIDGVDCDWENVDGWDGNISAMTNGTRTITIKLS